MPFRSGGKGRFEERKDGLTTLDGTEYKRDLTSCQFRDDSHILYVFSMPPNVKVLCIMLHANSLIFSEVLSL